MSSDIKCCLKTQGLAKHLFRRKPFNQCDNLNPGDLSRCLTTFDLTNLGIGSILGAGIFVVVGQVSSTVAGPSVIISLALAAFTSLLSGICYAEFGSRVPRTTGSAYSYSYHTVGEFLAFIIGWNLILEYMIGTAADARALSGAVDYLMDYRISNFSIKYLGVFPLTGAAPDVVGFVLTLMVTFVLACGVKESARYTIFFNVLTGLVAVFIIVMGATKAKVSNWNTTEKFFPKGVHGVLSGAATCFYAYVGYDIIATTGEEAKQPSRSIPLAMALTLLLCFIAYIGVAIVLTLMLPFGALVHSISPITEAFYLTSSGNQHIVHWIVGIGAVAGLSSSLMGSEFPLPRIIYAMSSDGLLFRWLSKVNSKTEVPVYATIVPGILTALVTMLFNLEELVEMMSIGTLLAYSLVCTSVLLLRYRPNDDSQDFDEIERPITLSYDRVNLAASDKSAFSIMDTNHTSNDDPIAFEYANSDKFSFIKSKSITSTMKNQYSRVIMAISLIWLLSIIFSISTLFGESLLVKTSIPIYVLLTTIILCILFVSIWLALQTQDTIATDKLHFKVPLMPTIPILAILFNTVLMSRLSWLTWVRFSVWLALGFCLYGFYGYRNSRLAVDHTTMSYQRLHNHSNGDICNSDTEAHLLDNTLDTDDDDDDDEDGKDLGDHKPQAGNSILELEETDDDIVTHFERKLPTTSV